MIITAIIAVFGKLLVSGRPRYIIERRPDTTPRARSHARARNACACITRRRRRQRRPSFRVHAAYTHTHTRPPDDGLSHIARAAPRHTYTSIRKHGYLSGGGLYACCRCKLAPGYRQRNRTRSHCMNIICIQVGYMAGGRHQLARPYKRLYGPNRCRRTCDPAQSAIGVVPFYALLSCLPSRPPSSALRTLALSQNALVMARPYNLWIPANCPERAPYANCRAISGRRRLTPRNARFISFSFFKQTRD